MGLYACSSPALFDGGHGGGDQAGEFNLCAPGPSRLWRPRWPHGCRRHGVLGYSELHGLLSVRLPDRTGACKHLD